MKWPCITLIIAPPFSRCFFVHSCPLRGLRMVDCASWVCIIPSMIVTPYRWMSVLMSGHKYFFCLLLPFSAQKAGIGVPRARQMGHQNGGMALLGVNDTKCFNEVQHLSPCVWQIGSTGKLEQMMWALAWRKRGAGRRGGGGVGMRETNLKKRLGGYLDALCFFFFFFFFAASWSTCWKWDCLVSSMVSMIPMVNASWLWKFCFYPVYLSVACQVVFSRSRIDLPKHKLDEKHEKTYVMPKEWETGLHVWVGCSCLFESLFVLHILIGMQNEPGRETNKLIIVPLGHVLFFLRFS